MNNIFVNGELFVEITNSAIRFCIKMLCFPLHIYVAYFLWKKLPFSTLFTILLFLPSVISGTVFSLIIKTISSNVLPNLFGISDLITSIDRTGFWTILIYDMWLLFANGMVLYLGAMGAISTDVVEYGKLEKMGMFGEFIHIIIPGIFPTIIAYIVADMAGFFTEYGSYFTFFGSQPSSNAGNTLGYHFFVMLMGEKNSISLSSLPYAATGGLFFTFIITPVTIFVKHCLEKFGPRED
jgi:ABC-type sugar transport system permease subunit